MSGGGLFHTRDHAGVVDDEGMSKDDRRPRPASVGVRPRPPPPAGALTCALSRWFPCCTPASASPASAATSPQNGSLARYKAAAFDDFRTANPIVVSLMLALCLALHIIMEQYFTIQHYESVVCTADDPAINAFCLANKFEK